MLEIERRPLHLFKVKEIWFSEFPFDVEDCDSVSFKALRNKVDAKGFVREEHATLVINLTKSLDEIWKAMDKSSCRYAINRAMKDGVKVKRNQNFDDFLNVYYSFRKRKGLSSFASMFYDPELEVMKRKYGTLFVAEYDGEILGGCFFIHDKASIRWLVGASRRLEVDKQKATLIGNANRLIIWEAVKWAKEKGIEEFDLGGYSIKAENNPSDPRYGINKFKKSFGGELVKKYFYYKDYSRRLRSLRNIYNFLNR